MPFIIVVPEGSVPIDASVPSCSNQRSAPVIDLETYVWPHMSARLRDACAKKEKADKSDKRDLIKTIVKYLCHTLGDSRRTVCYEVAQRVYAKYPQTFGEIIDGEVYGSGYGALGLSIYNGTLFLEGKDDSLSNCKSAKRRSTINPDPRNQKKRKTSIEDSYGCIEFNPELPQGESAVDQEQKRAELVKLYSLADREDSEIIRLMDETYPTQRSCIISQIQIISVVEGFPFLKERAYVTQHFMRLTGKNVAEAWTSFGNDKLELLIAHLTELRNFKKNKQAAETLITTCKEACDLDRSSMPKSVSIFPLMIHYFGEVEKYFMVLVKVQSNNHLFTFV